MQLQDKLYLESKILKYVRQDNMISFDGELAAKGMFLSDMQRRMWYFIRKNGITEHEIYKTARRLEDQGFIELSVVSGRVFIKPSTPKKQRTEDDLEIASKDLRIPSSVTTQDLQLGKAIAERYLHQRKREKEAEDRKAAIAPKEEKFKEDEDLSTLEDYLKDE